MSLENFIPEIWSSSLLHNLNKSLVYAQPGIVNRDYDGEISAAGDTVRINNIGRVSVFDYTKNTNHSAAETLTDAQRTLLIDQAKGFNFQVDDIDQAQQKPKVMSEAMHEAGYALANVSDQFVASKYTDADLDNVFSKTITVATQAYAVLLQLKLNLDRQNVPRDGRSAIVPFWFESLLLQDDRFVSFGTADNRSNLENGTIGHAAGFEIVTSNNVPNTNNTNWKIQASHPIYGTWADQINDVEAYRPELRFADAVKGLHLYGFKVVRPEALAVCTANSSLVDMGSGSGH